MRAKTRVKDTRDYGTLTVRCSYTNTEGALKMPTNRLIKLKAPVLLVAGVLTSVGALVLLIRAVNGEN